MVLIKALAYISLQCAQTTVIVRQFKVYSSVFKVYNVTHSVLQNCNEACSKIINGSEISDTAWMKLRETVNKEFQKRESFADAFIIDNCILSNNINALTSYMNCLKKNDCNIHFSVAIKYLSLITSIGFETLNYDEREIIDVTEHLLQKQMLLDSNTLSTCILALCLTKKWRKAYEILEEHYKPNHPPSAKIYSTIIWAAFKNLDENIGWKYLHEMASVSLQPSEFIHTTYLDYCKAKGIAYKDGIRDMFLYLKNANFRVYSNVISKYTNVYQKLGHIKYTNISSEGICKTCLHQLDPIDLTDQDYQTLQDVLVKDILGSDIYCKSTPKEWNMYKKFIEQNKPYDVVIDGLNIHFTSNKIHDTIQMVADQFTSNGKKVLILGRKHMKKFLKYQSEKVDVMLVHNYTDDDMYALYAAFSSGRKAGLVTLDLMRSHIFHIKDPATKNLFMKWFVAHQYVPCDARGKKFVISPRKRSTSIQQQGDYWHLPVYNTNKISDLCMFPRTWICMKL